MFTNAERLKIPSILRTATLRRRRVQELTEDGWWRPYHGFIAEPGAMPAYAARTSEHLAQVATLALLGKDDIIMAGTTAALLLGYPVWPLPHDIYAYRTRGRSSSTVLSPTPHENTTTIYHPLHASPPINVICEINDRISVTGPHRTAVDIARFASSETAFITVSSIIGQLASSGNIYRDREDSSGFSTRQNRIKGELLAQAAHLPDTSGRARARELITLADGQLESVGEARVLWAIRAHHLPLPTLQHRIDIAGNTYFCDFMWEEHRAIIEFNGTIKYHNHEGSQDRMTAERHRESLLARYGYRVLHLSWDDLRDPFSLAQLIQQFLFAGRTARPCMMPDLNRMHRTRSPRQNSQAASGDMSERRDTRYEINETYRHK